MKLNNKVIYRFFLKSKSFLHLSYGNYYLSYKIGFFTESVDLLLNKKFKYYKFLFYYGKFKLL